MAPAAAAWSRRRPRAGRRPGARLRSRSGRTGEPARSGPHRRLPGCREPTRAHGGGRLLPPAARPGLCRRHDPEHVPGARPACGRARPDFPAIGPRRKVAGQRSNIPDVYLHMACTYADLCWVLAALPDGRRDRGRDSPKMSVQAGVLVGRTVVFPSIRTAEVVGFSSRAAAPGKGAGGSGRRSPAD